MNDKPKIEGAAAALFAEVPDIAFTEDGGLFDQLGGSDQKQITPELLAMRLDIVESRLNEIYDFIVNKNEFNSRMATVLLPINAIHRNPHDAGILAQDTSRIPGIEGDSHDKIRARVEGYKK